MRHPSTTTTTFRVDMSFHGHQQLFERVETLQSSIQETLVLIQRLASLQPDDIDETSQEPLPDTYQSDLVEEIQDSLKQHEAELELIQQDVEDVTSAHPRKPGHHNLTKREQEREHANTDLVSQSSKLGDNFRMYAMCLAAVSCLCILSNHINLLSARIRFRKAQLQAKRNTDLALEQERAAHISSLQAAASALTTPSSTTTQQPTDTRTSAELRAALFAKRRPNSRNQKQSTQEEMVLSASSDLTSSLRRTHNLLTNELSRSRFAHETLETSNAQLKELNERYTSLDDLLSKSRSLLGTLVRSQKSDTWYLQTTLYILAATIAWLVFRKLLYGPMWWFVYLPFKLWYGMSWWVMSSIWGLAVSQKGKNVTELTGRTHGVTALSASASVRASIPSMGNADPGLARRNHDSDDAVISGRVVMRGEETPMSDMVSKMVEASKAMQDATASVTQEAGAEITAGDAQPQDIEIHAQREGRDQAPPQAQPEANIRRGDGQVLQERGDVPKNPKKRMMEDPPPMERRDEL